METDDVVPLAEPIDVVEEELILQRAVVAGRSLTAVPLPLGGAEILPPVVVGSESWHSGLPTTWLPVISRDIVRQRRVVSHIKLYRFHIQINLIYFTFLCAEPTGTIL